MPERAKYIRVVVAELERLHSHLLWAGVAAELVGFQTVFMHVFRLRERVMDLLEQISGNRVNYSMNRIGGVNRDIAEPAKVLEGIAEIRRVADGKHYSRVHDRCYRPGALPRRRRADAERCDCTWRCRASRACVRTRYGSAPRQSVPGL